MGRRKKYYKETICKNTVVFIPATGHETVVDTDYFLFPLSFPYLPRVTHNLNWFRVLYLMEKSKYLLPKSLSPQSSCLLLLLLQFLFDFYYWAWRTKRHLREYIIFPTLYSLIPIVDSPLIIGINYSHQTSNSLFFFWLFFQGHKEFKMMKWQFHFPIQ